MAEYKYNDVSVSYEEYKSANDSLYVNMRHLGTQTVCRLQVKILTVSYSSLRFGFCNKLQIFIERKNALMV